LILFIFIDDIVLLILPGGLYQTIRVRGTLVKDILRDTYNFIKTIFKNIEDDTFKELRSKFTEK
jgi:DNA gyrase inhibitor GyrI